MKRDSFADARLGVERWARVDDVIARIVADETFLAAPMQGTIHTLNPTASGVWRALSEPRTLAELHDAFVAAFPDADPDRINNDVRALLNALEAAGLVIRVEGDEADITSNDPRGAFPDDP